MTYFYTAALMFAFCVGYTTMMYKLFVILANAILKKTPLSANPICKAALVCLFALAFQIICAQNIDSVIEPLSFDQEYVIRAKFLNALVQFSGLLTMVLSCIRVSIAICKQITAESSTKGSPK